MAVENKQINATQETLAKCETATRWIDRTAIESKFYLNANQKEDSLFSWHKQEGKKIILEYRL